MDKVMDRVLDKVLVNIPPVVSLTIQGGLALAMFLAATLLEGVDITLLFALYIPFWSLQYTSAFRTYLDDCRRARTDQS